MVRKHCAVGIMRARLLPPTLPFTRCGISAVQLASKTNENEDFPQASMKWISELMSPVNGILPIRKVTPIPHLLNNEIACSVLCSFENP